MANKNRVLFLLKYLQQHSDEQHALTTAELISALHENGYNITNDWFVRGCSVVNDMEDRATVIEAIFLYDSDWWTEHPHIQAKLDALLSASEPVFGNVYFHE